MAAQVTWGGSDAESADLVNAIARNCTCEFESTGARSSTCASHVMLMSDQRALNGLLFLRRLRERLLAEEHG